MSMESIRACRPMRLPCRRSKRKSRCCASSRCNARDPGRFEERWGPEGEKREAQAPAMSIVEVRHASMILAPATAVAVIREDNVMQKEATLHVADSKAATRPEFAEILDRVRKLRSEIETRAL